MEDAYFAGFSLPEQLLHAELIARGDAAAAARMRPEYNATEVTVAAKDRRGLFADMATALSGMGANVVAAKVYTSQTGQALDVFQVQDAAGAPFGCDSPRLIERLTAGLEAAGQGEPLAVEPARIADLGTRRRPFPSPPPWPSTTTRPRTPRCGGGRPAATGRACWRRWRGPCRTPACRSSRRTSTTTANGRWTPSMCRTARGKVADGRKANALKGALLKASGGGRGRARGGRPRLERARASVGR